MAVKPIPEGYHTITPRLFVDDAEGLIRFLKKAFGALERPRDRRSPAEMVIGDSIVIVSGTEARAALPGFLYLYVPDVDAIYRSAIDAGAVVIDEIRTMHYGDRRATLRDRFGNTWQIATHVEDVSAEEIARRLGGGG